MSDRDDANLVVSLARQIEPGDVVFTGANSAPAVAACLLARRAHGTEFTMLTVAGAVDPSPRLLPLSSGGPELLEGSAAIFANEDFFDLCARGGVDKALLGAAQVDGDGRTNVSAIGSWRHPRVRLPGGGGAAMMMPTARHSVVWVTAHTPRQLVAKVDFATATGATALVTPLAIFRRHRDERFQLESHLPGSSVEEVSRETGFEFDGAGAVESEPASDREREALMALDVSGALTGSRARPEAGSEMSTTRSETHR